MKKNTLLLLGGILSSFLLYKLWQALPIATNNKQTIIILNGVGSSGKSSIIKEIQKLYDKPLLHTGLDYFWEMVPEAYKGHGLKANEGYSFYQTVDNANNPVVHITRGSLAEQINHTMPQVVKCLADCGHDVAVDEILIDDAILYNYATALKKYNVYLIGVVCDLEELERRERSRGDRIVGLARGQIDLVHKHKDSYDLIVDSTSSDAATCAKTIFNYINATSHPQGLKKLSKN